MIVLMLRWGYGWSEFGALGGGLLLGNLLGAGPHRCGEWIVTLWPLARDRLVTADEMAELLRRLHDTRPPEGLGEWLEVCFGRVRQNARALRTVNPRRHKTSWTPMSR